MSRPDAEQHFRMPEQALSLPAFDAAQSLERSVKDLPLVRPEEVARARALVADVKYPPDEMMSRIASLLAMHINK